MNMYGPNSDNIAHVPILALDVIKIIYAYGKNDRSILTLLSTNTYLDDLKKHIVFKKNTHIDDILGLRYYDQFSNISANDLTKYKFTMHKILPPYLPTNLVSLTFNNFTGYLKTYTKDLCHLKHLRLIGGKVTVKPGFLPSTVTHLQWQTNQKLGPHCLHNGLKVLHVVNYCYKTIWLPDSLVSLRLGTKTNIIENMFPPNLEIIHIESTVHYVINYNSNSYPMKKIVLGRNSRTVVLFVPDDVIVIRK